MSTPNRFRGGRSVNYVRPTDGTPSGREPPAPRWTPPAAAAVTAALRELAAEPSGQSWDAQLSEAFSSLQAWRRLEAAIRREASAQQTEVAMAVLGSHRTRSAELEGAPRMQHITNVLRALRRRAAECPTIGSIGIELAERISPSSFTAWIDAEPVRPMRETPGQDSGPKRYLKEWGAERVDASGAV